MSEQIFLLHLLQERLQVWTTSWTCHWTHLLSPETQRTCDLFYCVSINTDIINTGRLIQWLSDNTLFWSDKNICWTSLIFKNKSTKRKLLFLFQLHNMNIHLHWTSETSNKLCDRWISRDAAWLWPHRPLCWRPQTDCRCSPTDSPEGRNKKTLRNCERETETCWVTLTCCLLFSCKKPG